MTLRWLNNGWTILVACAWLESLNGSAYTFASYSQDMKLRLGFEQRSLDTIAFFKTAGTAFGIGPSLLFHHGASPWCVALLGLVHSSIGYAMTWAAMSSSSTNHRHGMLGSVWAMSIFQFLASNAQIYIQTAAIVRCVQIFPWHRGIVVGLLKGFLGVSASILLQLLQLVCGQDQVCNPATLAWSLPLLSTLPMIALFFAPNNSKPQDQDDDAWSLNILSGILVLLGTYLFGILVMEGAIVNMDHKLRLFVCAILIMIVLSPVCIMFLKRNAAVSTSSTDEDHRVLIQEDDDHNSHDFTISQALTSLNFWILFLVVVLASGCSSAVDGNLAQLGYSLGYTQESINIGVSLYSVASCLGRIGSGLVSEHFLHTRGTPRPLFLVVAVLTLGCGILWGGLGTLGALYGTSVLVGCSEGIMWCLAISTTSDLFGLSNFSIFLNVVTFACIPGSYIFSVLLVGTMYDRMASPSTLLCHGSSCFFGSFFILFLACIVAAFLCFLLTIRAKHLYKLTMRDSPQ